MKAYVDEDSPNSARILMLAYVIISLIMCGGSIFGFTPLKEILLDENVYQELCTVDDPLPCENQLVQLDSMFTLAASLFSAYLLPAGLCLRFLGPRFCFLTGFGLVILGSLGFAHASSQYFKVCYVLIGSGNPLLYISALNFGKLYPKSSNLLLSVFIGCFGFSSVVFYIFQLLHFELGWSSRQIFVRFSTLPLFLGIIGIFVLPPDPYHVQREKKLKALLDAKDLPANETTPLNDSAGVTIKMSDAELGHEVTLDGHYPADDIDPEIVPLKNQSIGQQLQSPQFLLQTAFFCWGMLHQNFYLGTIGDQIYMFAGDDPDLRTLAATILQKFSIFYPLECIMAILPVGALVRNCSVGTSLLVYCTVSTIFSGLALVPNVHVQWVTSAIYVVVRVGFFTVMSTYSATIFGFQNLGTMFGCAGCLAGLVSLLGSILSDRALHVDHSFVPVNTILLIGALCSFAFPIVVIVKKWQQE